MRLLVGATCVAVIAFIGYFFWGEYQARQKQKLAEIRAENLMCNEMLADFKGGKSSHDWRVIHIVRCLENKHLTEPDFIQNGLSSYLDEAKPLIGKL